MYITKQAEQEIHLIAQESNDGAPPQKNKHTQLSKLPVGALSYQWSVELRLTKFDSRLKSTFLEMASKRQQDSGAEKFPAHSNNPLSEVWLATAARLACL